MAIGIYFSGAMTAAKYDEAITALRKAGSSHPAGRSFHTAFGAPDKLMIFDVWSSQAAFDKFGQTLMPILQQLGVDPGKPEVMPVHSVIVPRPKAKPAAKRAVAKKVAKKAVKKSAKKKKR